MHWEVIYEKAIRDDGSLFFPEKLSLEFLEQQKRSQGSYIFSNQYMNEIIPADKQTFKQEWFKYYDVLPSNTNTFVFVDPALSENISSDSTGIIVVHVDSDSNWYVSYAKRLRVNPTKLIEFIFRLYENFSPQAIGVESVAYQKALIYFLAEEMQRRNKILPIKDVKPPTNKSKEMRILSLVPRFEWNKVFLAKGLEDLEMELLAFPRGAHDDLIDALAGIDYIAFAPPAKPEFEKPPGPQHKDYERWYIQNLRRKDNE